MKKGRKARPVSADAIARLADRGKSVSRFFANAGQMVHPRELNVSRQAVIKTLIRYALDQHYLAKNSHTTATRP